MTCILLMAAEYYVVLYDTKEAHTAICRSECYDLREINRQFSEHLTGNTGKVHLE